MVRFREAFGANLGPDDPLAAAPTLRFLAAVASHSPYLAGLFVRERACLRTCMTSPPEVTADRLTAQLHDEMAQAQTLDEAMGRLRRFKANMVALIALCDLGRVWPVMEVTRVLSACADAAVSAAVAFLLRRAREKGDLVEEAQPGAGFIVLAMGKHGARELNFSSDIDLIVFYDADLQTLKPGLEKQRFFVRITRDLVRLMQERTGDGYVFRTDLRLRPDPGATQMALSTAAALIYYESFGQNWERAALIKARVIAGDVARGEQLLEELAPFIWRRHLDFAAISDIHAMKRQIHAVRGFGAVAVAGHNIKLGRGGIREVEFFVQTQQLIAGGRQPSLRAPTTLGALEALVAKGWIAPHVRDELCASYQFLRHVEHRLQMVGDEQTQTLPRDEPKLTSLARFSGFETLAEFSAILRGHLERVQAHYVALFENDPVLSGPDASLVFAGETDDPDTVEALRRMGFTAPERVIETVRGWHHGRHAAVRSALARERLTVMQPALIEAFSQTADPTQAVYGFDRFLGLLPTGVQLFALLQANPHLLRLVADIVGTAPRLARILGRRRRLLDAVLDPGFFGDLPSDEECAGFIEREVAQAQDPQDLLDRVRVIGNEQAFLIGVRLLSGAIDARRAGFAYARLAERLIGALADAMDVELRERHGQVPQGEAAVIAMGKLGGMEMTASSDLDLILVYRFAPGAVETDGAKPLSPTQYFTRLTQRLLNSLQAPTAEGMLYEVDMRLRPSGQKGPLATQFSGFLRYQTQDAWTWEHLALTRARVISGPPGLREALNDAIRDVLTMPRDCARLSADVREMRERIAQAKAAQGLWDLKQVRGGLVDLEFIAQFLQLAHANEAPDILHPSTAVVFERLRDRDLLSEDDATLLIDATRLVQDLTQIQRLCMDRPFEPETAPDGLKRLLCRAGEMPDFARLEGHLRATLEQVHSAFNRLVRA